MDGGQAVPELEKVKPSDIKKFRRLTDFILEKFALEPQWRITILMDGIGKLDNEGLEAITSWPRHYRNATLTFTPIMVVDREEWVRTLIHELLHLKLAPLQDHMSDHGNEFSSNRNMNIIEQTTSELENFTHELFRDAYLTTYEKWL